MFFHMLHPQLLPTSFERSPLSEAQYDHILSQFSVEFWIVLQDQIYTELRLSTFQVKNLMNRISVQKQNGWKIGQWDYRLRGDRERDRSRLSRDRLRSFLFGDLERLLEWNYFPHNQFRHTYYLKIRFILIRFILKRSQSRFTYYTHIIRVIKKQAISDTEVCF